ncbi:DMT family transporter [Serpentinicella alkaliphila]|uniref:Transporter family-2 protein n=1 Tax=Serpentinicella alkaliphila TaxID=1734049 RepID=A0A4R2TMB9_9FIRM|nr:DMT family transporter [Serpentinicella alkaliphila]QUH25309.1 DMT family transporter [Serpentinicella alkaliphila]TCQ02405.1 transporter family-2 protein [Serpentinicella alkaliphila]
MIKLAALLIGALIAIMIQMNGTLGEFTNVYFSSFFTHGIGAVGILFLLIFVKQNKNKDINLSKYFYIGGALGAVIIILNNLSFQALGVSMTVALTLLGQVTASIVIDNCGLLNMEKVSFNKKKVVGLFLIIIGIVVMMFF